MNGSSDSIHAPPADLATRAVAIRAWDQPMFRSHKASQHSVFFGKGKLYRFDSPDGTYGVLYAGADAFCAFVESLLKNPIRVVTTTELINRAVTTFKGARPVRLIDLSHAGALVRIGADARLFSGDHQAARLWSKALHDHPVGADGLLYPSRLDPARQSIALFDDRAPELTEVSRQGWYAPGPQRRLLAEIAEHYQIALIDDRFDR